MMRRIFVVVVAMLTACGSGGAHYSGTVQTEFSSVGSQIGGRVSAVYVQVGSHVMKGALVVRLDPAILQAELDQARGASAAAHATVEQLKNGAVHSDVTQAQQQSAAAQAQVAGARADEAKAYRTYQRMRALVATGDVSRETYDQAMAAYLEARSQTNHLEHAAQAAHAGYRTVANGTRPEAIAQVEGQARNADAAVARALARMKELDVRAPVDGVVSSFNLHVGDMLAPNQTAATIDAQGDPYAYIYVAQHDIDRVRSAQHLVVHSDTGTGTYDAHVEAIDRNAQFTPQNVETADQRADLVYGMKIRISDPKRELLDGTTITLDLP